MTYTALYIGFVIMAVLLTNALIALARLVHQVKKPPVEEDYERLGNEKKILEKTVLDQNEEIVELGLRVKELEEQLNDAQLAQAEAENKAADAAAASQEEASA